MKKILPFVIALIIGAAGTLAVQHFVLKGAGSASLSAGGEQLAIEEDTSFDEVTQHLNPGGTFYMYLSTEKIIQAAQEFITTIRDSALENVQEPARKEWIDKVAKVVNNVLNDSGLFEISGVGLSMVPQEDGFNHSKMVVHHYAGKGKGLIWNMLEAEPHDLDTQKLLPANTVFARFSDSRLDYFWEWLNKEVEASGIQEIKDGFKSIEPMLQAKGIDLKALLGSFAGKGGFLITLDETKMCKLPVENELVIEFPDPAAALVLFVKDASLFELLKKSGLPATEENGIKKIQVPTVPAPITLNPTILQKDNLLIFATDTKLAEQILAMQAGGGEGLTGTAEFKKLSANMPVKGNGYTFLSSKIFKILTAVKNSVFTKTSKEEKAIFDIFNKLKLFPEDLAFYTVMQNTSEGFIVSSNNNLGMGGFAILPAAAVAGVVAAIAIPNLIAAKSKGELKSTMGDMKMIGTAIEMYIAENGAAPKVQSINELEPLLKPMYIKDLPLTDGWGNTFHYSTGGNTNPTGYFIGSGGSDGVFEGFDQTGFYIIAGAPDQARDIIFSNGMFVFGPQVN